MAFLERETFRRIRFSAQTGSSSNTPFDRITKSRIVVFSRSTRIKGRMDAAGGPGIVSQKKSVSKNPGLVGEAYTFCKRVAAGIPP